MQKVAIMTSIMRPRSPLNIDSSRNPQSGLQILPADRNMKVIMSNADITPMMLKMVDIFPIIFTF